MDPPPPAFVRVHLTCRACGEAETLDLQTHAMTPERLHRIWRRCAACLSCDLEIAEESGGHRPCPDAEQHGTVTSAALMRPIRGDC